MWISLIIKKKDAMKNIINNNTIIFKMKILIFLKIKSHSHIIAILNKTNINRIKTKNWIKNPN